MKTLDHIPQELFEKIEAYLNHSLPASEGEVFAAEIERNPALKQQVQEVQDLITAVEMASLNEKLDIFHQELKPDSDKKSGFQNVKIFYWAAACGVIVFGLYFFLQNSNSPEKLFAKHYSPDPGLPTTMSTVDNYTFYDGMVDYKLKKYQEALEKWHPLLQQKPYNDTLNYFVGVTYLALGDTEKALPYIDASLQTNESIFKDDAAFYKALILIKNNEAEAAKKLLKENPSERAQTLLGDLKE